MSKFNDLTGLQFGKLTVLYQSNTKNEYTVDTKIDELLNDVQYEIMKIAIKKEIGE